MRPSGVTILPVGRSRVAAADVRAGGRRTDRTRGRDCRPPRDRHRQSPPCSVRLSTRLGEPRRVDPRRAPDDIAAVWESFNEVARTNPKAAFPGSVRLGSVNPAKPTECSRSRTTSGTTVSGGRSGCRDSHHVDRRCELAGIAPDRSVYPLVALESSQSLSLSRRADLHRWPAMGVLGRVAEAAGERSPQSNTSSSTRVSRQPGCSSRTRTRRATATITGGMRSPAAVQQLRLPSHGRDGRAPARAAGERGRSPPSVGCSPTGPHRVGNGPNVRARHPISSPTSKPRPMSRRSTRTARCRVIAPTRPPARSAVIDLDSGRAVAACDDEALATRATGGPDRRRVAVEGRTFTT